MSVSPLLFASNARNVSGYATPVEGNGNRFLRIYETRPDGMPFPWLFAHHETARGAVHVVPIVTDKKDRQFVHLLIAQRPPLGGQLSIELPAGLWGDKDENETPLQAASRELKEETGYKTRKSKLLSQQTFATSTGMTTEEKAFALVYARTKRGKPQRDEDEKQFLIGEVQVPLAVFMNAARFERWIGKHMQKAHPEKEYIIGMDIPAARGLMPPLKKNGKKLDLKA